MFNGVQIGVGFLPKLYLTFCCTTINVKLGFMVVSLSIVPSQRLVAKSFCCNLYHHFYV
jgi:hypothetical protein